MNDKNLLKMNIKIGENFYQKNDFRKYHIVGFLENEEIPQIIYKYFGRYKQWWHYEVEALYDFYERFKIGLYSKKRGNK
jgi:hypothetical protein